MPVPRFLQSALWSCPVSGLDKTRDKSYIIPQILNHGSWDQIQWVLKNYRAATIKKFLQHPRRGSWYRDNLRYWTTIYQVSVRSQEFERAIISLGPKQYRAFQ